MSSGSISGVSHSRIVLTRGRVALGPNMIEDQHPGREDGHASHDDLVDIDTAHVGGIQADEFQEKAPHRIHDQIDVQQITRQQFILFRPAQEHQQEEVEQVPNGLVQEHGMEMGEFFITGQTMRRVNKDGPGQIGRRAVQLLVEEIAPTANGLRQSQSGHNDIRPGQEI